MTEPEADTPELPKQKVELTEEVWAEIRRLYEHDAAGIVELSARFGVSKQAISQHFKRKGVTKGSAILAAKEVAKTKNTEVQDWADQRAALLVQTKRTQFNINKMIQNAVGKLLLEANNASVPFSTKTADFKALKLAAEGLRQAREGMLEVLGGEIDDDDDGYETFEIVDLSEEDITKLRRRGEDEETEFESDDNDVVVEEVTDDPA